VCGKGKEREAKGQRGPNGLADGRMERVIFDKVNQFHFA
jgi:hypothetical protein